MYFKSKMPLSHYVLSFGVAAMILPLLSFFFEQLISYDFAYMDNVSIN